MDRVAESTPELIQLNCTRAELAKMPVFDRMELIPYQFNRLYGHPLYDVALLRSGC